MIRSWWARTGGIGAVLLALLLAGVGLLRNTAVVPRTIIVGVGANAVAIAPHSRRAFIVNSVSNTISVLNTHTGMLLATTVVGQAPTAVGVDEDTGRVFVPNQTGGTVSVLDSRSGHLLRKVLVGICPSDVAIAVHTGRVFVFNYDTHETISMLDARRGTLLSVVDPPGITLRSFLPNASADDPARRLFVVSRDPLTRHPSVTILDAASGRVRGIIGLAMGQTPLAVDTRRNRLVVGAVSGAVSVLNAMSGRLVRRIRLGTLPVAAAVDAPRRHIILVEQTTGRVTILDEASGALLHTISVPGATGPVAVDPQTGRVLVAGGTTTPAGRITVVDAARGRVLGTVTVGQSPVALAVDVRTGRAFVVNEGGEAPAHKRWWEDGAQLLRRWLPWLPWPLKPTAVPEGTSSVSILDALR